VESKSTGEISTKEELVHKPKDYHIYYQTGNGKLHSFGWYIFCITGFYSMGDFTVLSSTKVRLQIGR
jgi:hypothetical protein